MRMGKEYRADRIGCADLELFARDVGVRPRLAMDILGELVRAGSDAWNATASLPELAGHAPLIEGMRLGWDGRAGLALGWVRREEIGFSRASLNIRSRTCP
jgi:hypothetical protein